MPGELPAYPVTAYQGVPGAFSEEAAWALTSADARLLPCATLADVRDAVADGRAHQAVVPVENSLAGTVPRAYELLVDHDLTAVAETRVRIDHMLIAHPSASLGSIRQVHSHPVALEQCRRFVVEHALETVPAFDTAGAVAMVMAAANPHTAAIASRRAAALHGAAILAERIQDFPENWTRFLKLVPRGDTAPMRGNKAIAYFRLTHEPGSLHRMLSVLAAANLNLTKIESRPIPDRPFEYGFIVELVSRSALEWRDALAPAWKVSLDGRVLGAYTTPITSSPQASA